MLVKYLKKLSQLLYDDKFPLLGPNLMLLKFMGLWQPVKTSKNMFRRATVYVTIGFFFTQYIKCCINSSLEAFGTLIQYVPFHTAVVKAIFFIKDHDKWTGLITYVSSIEREELAKGNPRVQRIIRSYIKYSLHVTYIYWIVAILSTLGIYIDLFQKIFVENDTSEEYIQMFDGYTPWSRDPPGYYFIFITQTIFCIIVTMYVISWDLLIVAVMIFFANQLKVSGILCETAIDVNNASNSHQNIGECHRFHTKLVNYQEAFNSLISPVMFVYLVVTSVNLGVCITEMVELQDNVAELMSYCSYVLACLTQLLVFYWHSNEVTEESIVVSYSTFRSDWVAADVRLQRETAILAHVVGRKLVFRAGPFNDMSLDTFVAILRGSYSFYTLLNETN